MESLQNWVPLFLNDTKSNFLGIPNSLRIEGGAVEVSATLPTRPPSQLWTSSKLCAICFVAGIVVGYTLKPRVRGWAFGFLKRLKDD